MQNLFLKSLFFWLNGFSALLLAETAPITASEAAAARVQETSKFQFFLANADGKPTGEISLEKDSKGFYDLLFKAVIPKEFEGYSSWAFEAADPSGRHYYQMAFEGKVPEIVHWDGVFSDEAEVNLNKKYFFRLVLISSENKAFASPWKNFSTIPKKAYQGPKNRGEYVSLYVMPYGGTHYLSVRTSTQSAVVFPHLFGDFRVHLFDEYMCGMGFSTTANTLFGYAVDANGFGFSDISGFCRYRMMGAPVRAPILPLTPSYMGKDFKPVIPEGTWGAATNLEVGAKLFYTTLRGFPGSALDSEFFRSASGLALTLNASQEVWWLRVHSNLELGYSVLRGSVFNIAGDLGITYERIRDVSPGIQVKYSLYKGKPPSDQANAGTDVTNTLLFFGVLGYFKL